MVVTFNISFKVSDKPLSDKEIDDWKKTIHNDLRLRGWEDFTVEYQEDEDGKNEP